MKTTDEASSAPEIDKSKKSKKRPSKKLVIAILLAFAASGSLVYSTLSWRQNQKLKTDISHQSEQIQTLKDELDALKLAKVEDESIVTSEEETEKFEKLFDNVKIGQSVDTESGRLTVNSYEKTSLHDIQSAYTSIEQNILLVRLTISNTTKTTQTYYSGQFKFIDAAKIQKDTSPKNNFLSTGYTDFLDTVTIEPGGSIDVKVFFDGYDSKQGVLKWLNAYGQEVRIPLASL